MSERYTSRSNAAIADLGNPCAARSSYAYAWRFI
jgi:hypothetical protein